jgi:hypothetical protein
MVLIIVLFLSLVWDNISNAFYNHSHIINGKIVHHSHPYSRDKKHNHTEQELIIIKLIENNSRLILLISASFLLASIGFKLNYFILKTSLRFNKHYYSTNPIRAPAFSY